MRYAFLDPTRGCMASSLLGLRTQLKQLKGLKETKSTDTDKFKVYGLNKGLYPNTPRLAAPDNRL